MNGAYKQLTCTDAQAAHDLSPNAINTHLRLAFTRSRVELTRLALVRPQRP
jgi:hypothetical protein